MWPTAFKTFETFWQDYIKDYPLLAAVVLLILAQFITTFFQELKTRSDRNFQLNRERWNQLRDIYTKCLEQLSRARRTPIRKDGSLWIEQNSYFGALYSLTPLLALLVVLETESYLCSNVIQSARYCLQTTLNACTKQPPDIRHEDTPPHRKDQPKAITYYADAGLSRAVNHLIQVITDAAQKDLACDPNVGYLSRSYHRLKNSLLSRPQTHPRPQLTTDKDQNTNTPHQA